ncbi:MAG: DNA polymerase I, partial [Rikenellaceae bacterium]
MEKLFLIDAYALIFKFYYAFLSRPMRNNDGLNTSAIFGFTKFINDIISKEQPQHLGVAFDMAGGNFRHELYPLYKANRDETPPDIIASTPHIKRILKAMRIPILEMQGFEADDIIGTIAKKAACNDFEVFMVTPDKDYGQLIDCCINMYKPSKSGSGIEIVDKAKIKEIYGVDDPTLIIDILALWGDASDNIPGVPGIGEKTAVKLVNEYGTVENIIKNVHLIKGKNGDNIRAGVDQLLLSKKLATIDLNVPIAYEPSKLLMEQPDYKELRNLYKEMNFGSLISTIDFWERCNSSVNATYSDELPIIAGQTDLFNQEPSLFNVAEIESQLATIDNVEHSYTTISTHSEMQQLFSMLMTQKEVCFDTETTNINPIDAALVGMSFAVEQHKAYYIPLDSTNREATLEVLNIFKPFFENSSIDKIGQNIKYDLLVLKNYDIEVKGFLHDTMVIHYLLESDFRHGMDYMAEKYLLYKTIPISDLIGKGARQLTMDQVAIEKVAPYAAEDADITLQLYHKLSPQMAAEGLDALYRNIEEPLIRVLTDMEFAGVSLDKEALDTYAKGLNIELTKIEDQIHAIAGCEVNINSPKQLGELLFDRLKIAPKPKTTKTKQYKTDEEYLASLSHTHPIVDLILEYRSLKKLLSTYVEALPALINPRTGRIHTTYNQTVASTGRLSSNNPNLQNIPIRDERGKPIRRAFVAEGEGSVLLSADYSQVELRIMAILSGDENLLKAFNSGEDIHRATAANIYNVPLSEVTDEQRRRAKTANFGIIYGISPFGLATRLGISRAEAAELIDG